jgi:hypothetical protein
MLHSPVVATHALPGFPEFRFSCFDHRVSCFASSPALVVAGLQTGPWVSRFAIFYFPIPPFPLPGKNYNSLRSTSAIFRTGPAPKTPLFAPQIPPRLQLSRFGAPRAFPFLREEHMNTELSFKTAICDEHEGLLSACFQALETLRKRREEIVTSGLSGKEIAGELLRLQADYAKAYSRLEKHENNCELCRFVSKIVGQNNAAISNPALDKKRFA